MPINVNLSGEQKETPQVQTQETTNASQYEVAQNSAQSSATNQPTGGTVPVLDGIVNIPPNAPIVVLFGPTSCGKSMALKRLTRYLRNSGKFQAVEPERSFRPTNDSDYQYDCNHFNDFVTAQTKAAGTTGYMLVNVIEAGNTICRILEAPGEYYFDPSNPQSSYPNYMNTIIAAPVHRIWCIFVEPNWRDPQDRMNYVSRIAALKPMMQKNDIVLFVFNKIDETHFVITPGEVRMKQSIDYVAIQYPGIFNNFLCDIPILKWFKKYECDFVPFQTGLYQKNSDVYADSVDDYPAMLWDKITKYL